MGAAVCACRFRYFVQGTVVPNLLLQVLGWLAGTLPVNAGRGPEVGGDGALAEVVTGEGGGLWVVDGALVAFDEGAGP